MARGADARDACTNDADFNVGGQGVHVHEFFGGQGWGGGGQGQGGVGAEGAFGDEGMDGGGTHFAEEAARGVGGVSWCKIMNLMSRLRTWHLVVCSGGGGRGGGGGAREQGQ